MTAKHQSLIVTRLCGALAIVASLANGALAQTAGSTAKPNTTIPEKQHLGPVTPPHEGVVTPKHDADPDMVKTPPPQNPSETPVIPPSSTPGGNEAK